jgi:hypothetical protein
MTKELELIFYDKAEMTFHDTVPLPLEQLEKGRKKAVRQKDQILKIFASHPSERFTPVHIHSIYEFQYGNILITSVRRSISDLTKEGRLIKCQWSESKPGAYGKLNRCWKYNNEYLNRLNPQK